MKKILILGCCGWLALAGRAAESFVRQLTPEERHAAGLDQQTPEQQQALDALAARFASEGARVTETRVREEAKAEVAKAREEAKVQVETEVKKRGEALAGLEGSKHDTRIIATKIKGTFKGWSGRTLFPLENGQVWVQADKTETYWVPSQPGPDVEIRPSGIGGWKLHLQPNGRWVRVKRVN
jgi:hypothetical protein